MKSLIDEYNEDWRVYIETVGVTNKTSHII